MPGYTITCPACAHIGSDENFGLNHADECFCPQCQCYFELGEEEESDD